MEALFKTHKQQHLSPGDIKQLQGALQYACKRAQNTEALEEYAKAKGVDKRNALARFLVDPESGGCKATSRTTVVQDDLTEVDVRWVTEDALGGPLYLNNAKHAALYVTDMASRPHKGSKALREAGVLEYKLTELLRAGRTLTVFRFPVSLWNFVLAIIGVWFWILDFAVF